MTAPQTTSASYEVGYRKPPRSTQFQKGQSGNPSGKPGPASLARQRFQRALHAALSEGLSDLKEYSRGENLEYMARRLTRDAINGNRQALKLILSELDREIARHEPEPSAGTEAAKAAEEESRKENARQSAEPEPMPDYALWVKAHGKG